MSLVPYEDSSDDSMLETPKPKNLKKSTKKTSINNKKQLKPCIQTLSKKTCNKSLLHLLPTPKYSRDISNNLKIENNKKTNEIKLRKKKSLKINPTPNNYNYSRYDKKEKVFGSFNINSDNIVQSENNNNNNFTDLTYEFLDQYTSFPKRENQCIENKVVRSNISRFSDLQKSEPEIFDQTLIAPDKYFHNDLALNPKLIDVNASELRSTNMEINDFNSYAKVDVNENKWKGGTRFWDSESGRFKNVNKPSAIQKRKHHINSLAIEAENKLEELNKKRAKGYEARQLARAKYGW